jgi:hypothetical protein
MEFGDEVFIIQKDEIVPAEIRRPITRKGVVTGYEIRTEYDPRSVKFLRKDIFTDKQDATKALFVKNLKANEEKRVAPGEDIVGDRHWIKGHKRHK